MGTGMASACVRLPVTGALTGCTMSLPPGAGASGPLGPSMAACEHQMVSAL